MKIKSVALISGLLLLSAIVLFAGTASAIESIGISPDSINIADGETGTFTVTVLPSQTTNGDFKVDLYNVPGVNNFSIVIKDDAGAELAFGSGDNTIEASPTSYTDGVSSVFYVEVTNNGAPSGQYGINFAANDGTVPWEDDASIWAGIDSSIPEFATIAIPVAGIMGLFLFFNHRKRKEK
jgi:hypothetical protein